MNIDTIGFMFKACKVIIKCDEMSDYGSCECNPYNTAEWVNYNDKCLVSVFKLKKQDFITSSIGIATSNEQQWNILLNEIECYYNKPFIISLSKKDDCNKKCFYLNNYDSFYSKLINSKFCPCCDSLFLFFKFNVVVNLFTSGQTINPFTTIQYNSTSYNGGSNNVVTSVANLTYDLQNGEYSNVKFYFNPNDAYLDGSCNSCNVCPKQCC